jgi:hypothetical protein
MSARDRALGRLIDRLVEPPQPGKPSGYESIYQRAVRGDLAEQVERALIRLALEARHSPHPTVVAVMDVIAKRERRR